MRYNVNFTKNSKSYKIRTISPISAKLKNQTNQIFSTIMKRYSAQNLNFVELGVQMPFFGKFKIL